MVFLIRIPQYKCQCFLGCLLTLTLESSQLSEKYAKGIPNYEKLFSKGLDCECGACLAHSKSLIASSKVEQHCYLARILLI